ncbi:hypothetical protein BBFL7_01010 [Flavobacteria bacterium BBFL7]|nr:hypothetical protein BBFL7_01010 [Flavobacteria bacterium BBFL7]
MKLWIAALLSLVLLSNSLRTTIMYSWYIVDLDSFVERLCENKDKPTLNCDGKCYLSKMMAEGSKDESPAEPLIEWEEQIYFFEEISFPIVTAVDREHYAFFYYQYIITDSNIDGIFHPPRFS